MSRKRKSSMIVGFDSSRVMRRLRHEGYVAEMREGRRTRAQTFASGKEYRRNEKHRKGRP